MIFNLDPEELHQFPDRLFRRELQVPTNLRELIEDGQEEVQIMSTTLGETLEQWAVQRGVALGMEREIEQGIERGRLETSQALLCQLLEDRFGALPDELRQQVEATRDLTRWQWAIRRSPSLPSLDELQL